MENELAKSKKFEHEEILRLRDALKKTRRDRVEGPLEQPKHLRAEIIITDADLSQNGSRS